MNKIEYALKKPFRRLIWKNQNGSDLAYLDGRMFADRLDEAFGLNWSVRHYAIEKKIYCEVGWLNGGEWIFRTDTGEETNWSPDKGAATTAMKRAACLFGIGRYLYDLPKPDKSEFKKELDYSAQCTNSVYKQLIDNAVYHPNIIDIREVLKGLNPDKHHKTELYYLLICGIVTSDYHEYIEYSKTLLGE